MLVGNLLGGWLADKLWTASFMGLFILYALNSWLTKLLAMAGYSLGSALTSMGVVSSPAWHYLIVALVGATTTGTQTLNLAYAAQFYPTAICSTGVGFASGVGRIGAIFAPILIGLILGCVAVAFTNYRACASARLLVPANS